MPTFYLLPQCTNDNKNIPKPTPTSSLNAHHLTCNEYTPEQIASINPYRYVGEYGVFYDSDTNLYFMGFRDYEPTTGRFIVPDTYHGEDDRPFSQNKYMYGHGDPVNFIDPSGHGPKEISKTKLSWADFVRLDHEGTSKANVYAQVSTDKNRLSDVQQKANAQYIYDYLSKEGWSKEAICGLLGNIEQESHLNPGVWQDSNNTKLGYGLIQWDDATKFIGWAGLKFDGANEMAKNDPKQLIDMQLKFLIWSSQRTTPTDKREWYPTTKYDSQYKMTFAQYIVSTHSAEDLALVFHGSYERSSDDAKRKQNRKDYANKWYKFFNK